MVNIGRVQKARGQDMDEWSMHPVVQADEGWLMNIFHYKSPILLQSQHPRMSRVHLSHHLVHMLLCIYKLSL